jgi:hypothetical protein
MALPHLRLPSSSGTVAVRSARAALDGPAAGLWTPDNRNANEIGGGEVPTDFILDAREWEDVRIVADFAGALSGAETVEVQPLIGIPKNTAPGRDWATLPKFTLAPQLDSDVAPVRGHFSAFRITALSLGTGTSVTLKATGGTRRKQGS